MNDWPTSLAEAREQIIALRDKIERLEKEVDFWTYSADKYWQQAMQYRKELLQAARLANENRYP